MNQDELDIALLDAVKNNDWAETESLLQAGASASCYDNQPILTASYKGYSQIVELLIDKGVDVNCRDNGPLHLAVGWGDMETIKVLLDAGAEIGEREYQMLHGCLDFHRFEVFQILIDRYSSLLHKHGEALLRAMCGAQNIISVSFLLELGIKPSLFSIGRSLYEGNLDILNLFVQYDFDMSVAMSDWKFLDKDVQKWLLKHYRVRGYSDLAKKIKMDKLRLIKKQHPELSPLTIHNNTNTDLELLKRLKGYLKP